MQRVPPPPESTHSLHGAASIGQKKVAPASEHLVKPLDDEFIGRTFVSSLWVGTVATIWAYTATRSLTITLSLLGGLALGALMLKSQQVTVRRLAGRKKDTAFGRWDARIPLLVLAVGKYFIIGAAIWFTLDRGWMNPAAFVTGFLIEQIVLVAKVIGRYVANMSRSK